jgi:hypothetical protein
MIRLTVVGRIRIPAGRRRSGDRVAAAALACALVAGACSGPAAAPQDPPLTGETATVSTEVNGERLVVEYDGLEWDFMAGVNLGATIPGHYPGELAVDAETYRSWFPMMTEVGFRVIRVYTIQNPAFYRELRAYNVAHADDPLLLVHGVWMEEERFIREANLYDDTLTASFDAEIADAVQVVTGRADLASQPGHAHGVFDADVSDWVVGWIIGIELDPSAVRDSDHANRAKAPFSGHFFSSTDDASPTESWYAARLERLSAQLDKAGLAVPLAFSNWPTTDPLIHLDEPIAGEDIVGIDANHVRPTPEWSGGYFAAYHAYPYFPDFQRYEPGIADFVHEGRVDPYAGYLTALKEHHEGIPVVIAEVGVSGGMAAAHAGPLDRNQGANTEQNQMATNAELLEVIHDVGLAGGLVFEWADEWFKASWNTIDYETRDRRALWDNQWTNEAQFGVLAVEPGPPDGVVVGGSLDDWDESTQIAAADGLRVRAQHDAGFVYLLLEFDGDVPATTVVGFDVLTGGSAGVPSHPGSTTSDADTALIFGPNNEGRALVRRSNDPTVIRFADKAGYFETEPAPDEWNEYRLLTSHPLQIPTTGESLPAEYFAAGALVHGTTDITDSQFDSRSTWYRHSNALEIRVPYAAIGIADPSSRQALVVAPDGSLSTESFDEVGITVWGDGVLHQTTGYSWGAWQAAEWHQRLRVGYEVLSATLAKVGGGRR